MKKLLLFLFLLMLLMQAIEKTIKIQDERGLTGAFILTKVDSLTLRNWFSVEYQQSYTSNFGERIGFRPTLIRLFNQVSYSIFNQEGESTVIVGKSGYLYQDSYIWAYRGKDKVRSSELRKKIRCVYQLQKYLEKKGIHFILVFAPSKARIYPEYIPSRFFPKEKRLTNYEEYIQIIRHNYPDLNFLDMNAYFGKLKKTVTVPLYAKGGTHWSNYTLYKYFMDTLVREMASIQHQSYPPLIEKNFHWSFTLSQPDDDLRQLMNLYKSKHAEQLPYADFFYKPEAGFSKPSLLMVSDSYYSMLYSSVGFNSLLSKNNFWYYNNTRYPVEDYKGNPDSAFLRKDILNHDFVILMATEMNIGELFQFPEKALTWLGIADSTIKYSEADKQARIQYYISAINHNSVWLNSVKAQMKTRNKPLEELIRDNAIFMEKMEHQKNLK